MEESPSIPTSVTDRRTFIKKASLGAGLMVFPSFVGCATPVMISPNSRLNIALVGVGGKGATHLLEFQDESIIALCDVDENRVQAAKEKKSTGAAFTEALAKVEAKGARWFKDYRVMFEELGDQIDAVVIATPDHMHFPIALSALNLGKHVYCEKPLTHTVEEARMLKAAAEKAKVVTQMGNQGHSTSGTRAIREWIQAGVIGQVREVHSWTNRPIWAQGQGALDKRADGASTPPVGLDWDLWQGVAERRDFNSAAVPFGWRSWTEYGCGSLGDMACHIMDAAYWALDLGRPEWIESITTPVTDETYPQSSTVTFRFPERGSFDPLTYRWYDGGLQPLFPSGMEMPRMDPIGGTLYVGEEAMILASCYSDSVRILPDAKFEELKPNLPCEDASGASRGVTSRNGWMRIERVDRPVPIFLTQPHSLKWFSPGRSLSAFITGWFSIPRMEASRTIWLRISLLSKIYPDGWILS